MGVSCCKVVRDPTWACSLRKISSQEPRPKTRHTALTFLVEAAIRWLSPDVGRRSSSQQKEALPRDGNQFATLMRSDKAPQAREQVDTGSPEDEPHQSARLPQKLIFRFASGPLTHPQKERCYGHNCSDHLGDCRMVHSFQRMDGCRLRW